MITTDQLLALKAGRISFATFATEARGDFQAMATALARRWGRLPASMEVGDLTQAMLLSVYEELPGADPNLGPIKEHVVFRAYAAARSDLRRASAHAGRDDLMHMVEDTQLPQQEDVLLARERLATLPNDERQRVILHSLLHTMSFEDTTRELLDHPDTRAIFTNPETADRSVYRTALKLRDRAAAV